MIDTLLGLFVQYGYAIVFVAILLDNAGLPIPGELLLLLFGALARNGDGSAVLGLLLASVAAVAGDSVGYWLGRLSGEAPGGAPGGNRARAPVLLLRQRFPRLPD